MSEPIHMRQAGSWETPCGTLIMSREALLKETTRNPDKVTCPDCIRILDQRRETHSNG